MLGKDAGLAGKASLPQLENIARDFGINLIPMFQQRCRLILVKEGHT